jgi:hypothetical protein
MLWNVCALLLAASGLALGQGMVEYGAVSGSTATAINSSGKQLGGSIGAIMGKATEAATGEKGPGSLASPGSRKGGKSGLRAPALPARKDVADTRSAVKPDEIKNGMSKDELIAAAGKPYIKISMDDDGHAVERFSYLLKDGGKLGVELTDGKVTEVKPVQPE